MCTLCFKGYGYAQSFVDNYREIHSLLNSDDSAKILLISHNDDVCNYCPMKRNQYLCQKEEKISRLDLRHGKVLGLSTGDILSWREAKDRISQRMSIEKFHIACNSCSWKKHGICEQALRMFLS